MRKFIVIAVVAALAIMLASQPVSATWFPGGEYTAGGFDRSNLYFDTDLDGHADALPPVAPIFVGQEQRTVFDLTAISFGYDTVEGGLKRINALGGSGPPYIPSSLTGMLYDIQVLGFGAFGPPAGGVTPYSVYFGNNPLGGPPIPGVLPARYADAVSGGGTDGAWTDTSAGLGGFLASTAGGFSGLVVVYDDAALNFNFAGDGVLPDGAADWREPGDLTPPSPHPGAAAMGVPGVLTDADYFPTASDVPGSLGPADSGTAVPWLVMTICPLPDNADLEHMAPPGSVLAEYGFTQTAPGVGTASGTAFLNVIGGTFASEIIPDFFNYPDLIAPFGAPTGPGADIRIDFEISFSSNPPFGTPDGWQVRSDDPWQFGVQKIPEPASMTLLGLSLLGLVGVKLRKKS